jgi:DegV family protein with EDD domain
VRVITDSTAALDAATAAACGVTIVPTLVTLGGVSYRDGDLPLAELLERFDEGVSTSGPPPGAFVESLEGAGDGAVVLTVASRLSSTFKAATIASAVSPDRLVRVLDTGTAAGAQALAALHAARVAAGGGSLDEVEAAARSVAQRARLCGVLETLEYLVRGGRINSAVGRLASALRVRPLFELQDGTIRSLRPSFSREGAMARLLRIWRRSRVEGARLHVIALHALAPHAARYLLDRVCREVEPATALVAEFGAVMVVHTGPGLVALSWWWEEG